MEPNERHILDELKKAPTELPSDAYFQQLKTTVLSQLSQTKVVPLYKKWWAISAAAASVAVVVGLFFLKEATAPQQTAVDWNSVSKEEVLAYIEDNIDHFEAETIATHLAEIPEWHETVPATDTTVVVKRTSQPATTEDLFDDLEHKEILEYLQNEAIDIDDDLLIGS